ncbi:MAG: tetratricopeptide repeat protein [Euryarchaeota archaeon]|nr:tetratricopeptide repeat protein [Euryarchaeota archaeon]MDE1878959.1 tetratricopeptide repeat protein [Euryarchaeota archaeon]
MSPTPSGPAAAPVFVGREAERSRLQEGVDRARGGQGNSWVISGPAGVGKTRLMQWLEGEAQTQGFRVLWGYCLKEDVSPFFPFEQILHRLGPRGGSRGGAGAAEAGVGDVPFQVDEAAAVVIFEEEKPKRIFDHASALSKAHPCLVLGRDRPQSVRQRFPELAPSSRVLWLSRTEGEEVIPPSQLDALGELAEKHLRQHEGGVVALAGIEYLVSQNTFLPVLRLLQFLRDVAEGTGGKLLLSVHPAAFDAREFSLLEAEGEVVKAPSAASPTGGSAEERPSGRGTSEPSSATLLRYVQTFEAESRNRPLLLLLDDFQWADEGSALAFQFLSRNLRRAPVILVAGVRDAETRTTVAAGGGSPQEGVVVDVMDNLDREGILRRLPLRGLDPGEARDLLEGYLGAPLAPGDVEGAAQTLVELTGGNPYHLLQVVSQLKEEGLARVEGGRGLISLPAPTEVGSSFAGSRGRTSLPTIRRLVSRQLEGLPKEDRALLETASLVGREFDLPPLADVLGRSREDLKARAEKLTTRPPLLTAREDGKRYAFQNPIVWEVAREELSAEDRRRCSRTLADWFTSRRPEETETIARLYYEARDRTKGLPWIRKAADKALRTQASDAVERYVRWAEDLLRGSGEDWEGRVMEGVRLAEGIREQGAIRDARRLLQGLLEAGPPDKLRWRVQRALVMAQADIDAREARTRLEELERSLQAMPEAKMPECRSLLAVTRAHVLTLAGSWEEGLAAAREALQLLSEVGGGDPAERAQALYAAGWCLKQLGRLEEAREQFAQGRAAAAVAERPGLLASHMNGEGAVALLRGDLPAARRAFEDAVEQCRKTGNVARVASILLNMAEVALNLGDLEAARKAAEEAQALGERFDVPRVAANATFRMGVIHQKEKRWEEARTAFQAALERYDRLGLADLAYSARINLALLRGIMGDPQSALVELEEMVRKSVGVDLRNLPLYHQARAELKGFTGDSDGAKRELERGLEAARSTQNLLSQASLHEALGAWEDAHGDPARARVQREQAEALFRQCGLPKGSTARG